MISIARRFNGPPDSANGGYACGVSARLVDGPAEVTLRAPPPLETPLDVVRDGDTVQLLNEGTTVIEARPIPASFDPPPFVSLEQALEAQRAEGDLADHVFPTCFVCGPARKVGDGLRIFSGPVAGTDLHAATWLPDPSLSHDGARVTDEIMWAALDCPSGWSAIESNASGRTMLLGRLAAQIHRPARIGERLIVTSRAVASEGRKHTAVSAVYAEGGELLANGRALWITLR